MGAYRDSTKIDLNYGEAIVEMRSIKNISAEALSIMLPNLNKILKGKFLVQEVLIKEEKFSLLQQVKALFNYLNNVL